MLLTPFFSAAILLWSANWLELVALVVVVCAFAVKDPLLVLARQRTVWKQEHPETRLATRVAFIELLVLAGCAAVLVSARGWRSFLPLFLGGGAFTALAVAVNVLNRQRSAWFQVASAVALTSSCLMACLSVQGKIVSWCWLLWILSALQASAGIFVVHARLDARAAARKANESGCGSRRAAFISQVSLAFAAAIFALFGRFWIATALLIAAACYLIELRRQVNLKALQMPLTRVGQQALALSIVYTVLVIVGLS